MKAIMSDKLREIIRDPKKSRELRRGLIKLGYNIDHGSNVTEVSIGNHTYKIQFVSPFTLVKKEQHK